jgi:hypothetical protein
MLMTLSVLAQDKPAKGAVKESLRVIDETRIKAPLDTKSKFKEKKIFFYMIQFFFLLKSESL